MSDKVFFITGTSSGFGEALVKDALQRRYKVIATARRLNSIHHLKKLGAHCLELDVTSESINETAQVAVSIYGRVDYLINNAGIAIMGNLEEFNYADIRKIYETNVFGLMRVTNAFLPFFRQAGSGRIVNISSELSGFCKPGLSVYASTKAAVDMYTDCLNFELQQFGIDAISIQPGAFETSISSNVIQIDQSQKLAAYAKSTTSADKMVVSSLFGTPEAAAARMLDVITLSGVASGRKLPSRFALGEDALLHLNNFHKRRLADVEDWRDLSVGEGLAGAPEGESFS